MRERQCGCITFCYGPPILCSDHSAKAERKAQRAQSNEEKGLRKLVRDQVEANGHDLTRFLEYQSQRGKWTAYCRKCGHIVIVYDEIPPVGDQLSGKPLSNPCKDAGGIFKALEGAESEDS